MRPLSSSPLRCAERARLAAAASRFHRGRQKRRFGLVKSERSILESITDGFFVLDHDWRVTYINAAGERFLNRAPGDLIGKSVWEEFPDTVGSEFERVYRRVAAARVGESFTAYYPNLDRWY